MKKLIIPLVLFMVTFSCKKINDGPAGSFLTGSGVFILDEGNFMGGNGSLSFYSYDSAKIYNDLFLNINGRPLGDVPNSIQIRGDNAYIVVNNSGKIEVINKNSLKSIATISELISPRNMAFVNDEKAYVTSIYSDSVIVINLNSNSVSGYIDVRRSSESVLVSGNKAFVSNWMGGNEIMVINTLTDKVVDSLKVGVEPETMVIDKNNKLWVLCNGGWMRNNFAELIRINTSNNLIEKDLVFPVKEASPTSLQIDGKGETLYYLEQGVHQMSVEAAALPVATLIPESGHFFYKLGINPVNNDIFVTDAIDYQQKGYVLYYKKDGTMISSQTADIIPGLMCFKLTDGFSLK